MESVCRELGSLSSAEEEPPLAVFTHHMAGVDVGHSQIHGFAPGAIGGVGCHHEVHAAAGLQSSVGLCAHGISGIGHRKINIIFVLIFANVRCPYGTQEGVERRTDGLPVNEVAAMEDRESRHVVEGAVRHVIVVAVAHDGRVGIVTSQNGVCKCSPLCQK